MNKITTLAAISMFAVMMGMSAFAPAIATPNNPQSQATAAVCHYFVVYQWVDWNENGIRDVAENPDTGVEELEPLVLVEVEDPETGEITLEPIVDETLSQWGVLYVNNHGQLNGHHNGHGDDIVDDSEEPVEDSITTAQCLEKNDL